MGFFYGHKKKSKKSCHKFLFLEKVYEIHETKRNEKQITMKTYKTNQSEFQLKKIKTDYPKVKITSSLEAEKVIRQFYSDDIGVYESFFILLLNRQNITIGHAKISQGGIVGTVVDPKLVAKYTVDSLASGVILAHNHPSGGLKPSNADLQITEKIKNGLKLFDVSVLDHLILTEESYLSFADENKL